MNNLINDETYADIPVSYTHLDVYKRQRTGGLRVSGCFNPEPDLDNANVGR